MPASPTAARSTRIPRIPTSPSASGSTALNSSDTERELLAAGGRELRVALAPAQLDDLVRLVDELELANAQFNLTAIRDRQGMLLKHVLDSLTLQPFVRGERMVDVGTGAGFPGLALAVVNPERHVTLIESVGKKARYVEQTVARLKLRNVEVVNGRAESYRPVQLFDTVMARALAPLADFVAFAGHLCAPGGRLLAMKGKRPDQEISALPKSFRVVAVHELAVPGLPDQRHLVELSRT